MTIRVVAIIFILILVYATYSIGRSSILLARSQSLYKESAAFKTDYYVGKASDPSQLLVAIGDSTAVGTGASKLEDSMVYKTAEALAQKGSYIHVMNLAKSGAKIADVISSQLPHLSTLKPAIILVSVGANDATHFTNLDQYQKSLQSLSKTLIDSGATTIVFATSPDMHLIPAFPTWFSSFVGSRSEQENSVLRRVTSGGPIRIVDIYHDGKLDYSKDHGLYASDLFHPSSKGYAIWANLFAAAVLK